MYNHILKCDFDGKLYKAVCESAPEKQNTILFWPDDLGIPSENIEAVIQELMKWAEHQDFEYNIYRGKGR